MQQELHVTARVGIVGALHLLLAYLFYDWWTLGPYYAGHSYLPGQNFLLWAAASVVCLVLVFPVLLRGRALQRGVAFGLSLLPGFLFILSTYYVLRITIFGRG